MDKKTKTKLAFGALTLATAAVLIYVFRRKISNTMNYLTTGSYFTISELCKTSTGIANTPTETIKANLQKLITNMLDPIRAKYGSPIVVSSGYRSAAVNAKVGGVSNSQHLTGHAADLVGENGTKAELGKIFLAALDVGGYDQLIFETNKKGSWWVHVSWVEKNPRKQVLGYNGSSYATLSNPRTDYLKYV